MFAIAKLWLGAMFKKYLNNNDKKKIHLIVLDRGFYSQKFS